MKFRRNRCKIIIFEFPFTTETLHWLFWIWIMQSNWIWKKLKQVITSQLLTKHFASLLFLLLWRPPLRYFLNVAFALLLRKKPSETTFPHRLNYGENYKIFILPIVQKTARKKNIHNFKNTKDRSLFWNIFWSSLNFKSQKTRNLQAFF